MTRSPIPWLDPDPDAPFPPAARALREPNGLLAVGGDLSVARLLNAYRHGIFPWYSEGQPILWWCPDPRAVFATGEVRPSTRFRRSLRSSHWIVRADTAFDDVVAACATLPRRDQDGTWITAEMRRAYGRLYRTGHAHSVEVFDGDALVGGLYGVAVGRMFFGESMFSARSGGSKLALFALAATLAGWGWPWIDAQIGNAHTRSLGCRDVARSDFLAETGRLAALPGRSGPWTAEFGEHPASHFV